MNKHLEKTSPASTETFAFNVTQIVHIVDDDEAVRDSMSMLLESAGIPHRSYLSATDFLSSLDAETGGCLVLDIRMPEMSGLELQQKLNELKVNLPIIFMTGHGDIPMAVRAMRHGAIDFMRKPVKEQNLFAHIEMAFKQEAEQRDEARHLQTLRTLFSSLTEREQEVFGLVVQGITNKVIAQKLAISERTVEVHRSNMMEKLNASTLAQLVRLSIESEQIR